jgi:hypothetical protein
MNPSGKSNLELLAQTIQVVSIVVGVVISVLNFSETQRREGVLRQAETDKPFLLLKQKVYLDAVRTTAKLVTSTPGTPAFTKARDRFRQLYIAELSMVETPEVAGKMVDLANEIDQNLLQLTPAQRGALNLSHALRDSFRTTGTSTP